MDKDRYEVYVPQELGERWYTQLYGDMADSFIRDAKRHPDDASFMQITYPLPITSRKKAARLLGGVLGGGICSKVIDLTKTQPIGG